MSVKHMKWSEFVNVGLLHEINRRFLHPMGLALEVTLDTETLEGMLPNDAAAVAIWDYRDDPEGVLFADGALEPEKVRRVQQLFDAAAVAREKRLGYVVQPVDGESRP